VGILVTKLAFSIAKKHADCIFNIKVAKMEANKPSFSAMLPKNRKRKLEEIITGLGTV